jgi:outer membrane receptor protein involved in Fe transport
MKKIFILFLSVLCVSQSEAQINYDDVLGGNLNTITTAVPFLLISPDSKAGAMGDVGVATSPDANSMHWNPAKLSFTDDDLGVAVSIVPWLRELVPDINLQYIGGYFKLNENEAIGYELRYFTLGNITFTDNSGNIIGQYNPNEMAFGSAYSRKLSDHFEAQAGGFMSVQTSFSSLYPGITLATFNPAIFGQIEGKHGRLRTVLGARYENNINPGFYEESSGSVLRAGINYEICPGTNFRASYGESYRFASLAEKYFSTNLTDGIDIVGNLDLKSESGINIEAGIKNKLRVGGKNIYLDAAVFMIQFEDLIEYTLRHRINEVG